MAALQKIRNKSAILILAIGVALFAFIAEEFFRSLQTTSNIKKQQVGEVYGEKLSVQDFQKMVDEASELYKLQSGGSLNDQMQDRIRDEVWNGYVYFKLVEHEASKLGLIVTEEEVQNALREGTATSLRRLSVLNRMGIPFVDASGRFSVQVLQDFYKQYKEIKAKSNQVNPEILESFGVIDKIWTYTEGELRKELLMTKFNALFQQSFISNPISAKMFFEESTVQSNVELAAVPYSTVDDKEVSITDDDLKAMYKKNKELFRMPMETRDIRYIDVEVKASAADRAALEKNMQDVYSRLSSGEDISVVVNSSKSVLSYVNAPLTKNAFSADVRAHLDSMAVGTTKATYYNPSDNTLNVIKLVSKVEAPDSMLVRLIGVQAATQEEAKTRADSIMTALQGGAKFADIAKRYNQPGDSAWITSSQYENAAMDEDGAKYVTALNTTPVNGLSNVELTQGRLILQVLDRRDMKTKYNAAVVKCPVDFSKETYRDALNKLNRFIADYRTLEQIEKNAGKSGYIVKSYDDFQSSAHNVGGVGGTKDAVRWIFDEAAVGDVSKLYECGTNNDHLLLIALKAVHEKGYRPWDDPMVKELLTKMVMSEKKGELLAKKLGGVKDMAAAKKQSGVVVDTLSNVTFLTSPFVAATGVRESIISGGASKTAAGKFCGPLKGSEGIYMLKVLRKNEGTQKYEEKVGMEYAASANLRAVASLLEQVLLREADVEDNRYKF